MMKFSIPYKKGDFRPLNFAMLVVSGLINATGVTLFLAPANLYDSGISGTSMFMDVIVAPVPLWAWLIILNFPIFLFSLRQGLSFTVYSLFAIAMYSGFSAIYQNVVPLFAPDFFAKGSPIAGSDLLLCGIFGGLLSGIGSGLTIRYGGALDGIEQLAVIFARRLNMTVGNFVMIFNVALYIIIGIYFKAFELPLYSVITYFVASKAVDFIVQGLDQAKGAFIIPSAGNYDAVSAALSQEFGRGLTIIPATGYYSGADKKIIYCVINRFQLARMRSVLASCDRHAFVTVMDISDVFGTSIKNSNASDRRRARQLKEARLKAAMEAAAQRVLEENGENSDNVKQETDTTNEN